MRLESALYTSREGLVSHGQAISVVGDNISNANTTGYKSSRPEFAELVTEGLHGRESTTVSGGGNGVTIKQVRTLYEPGTVEYTGRNLDLAIGGDGFFVIGSADEPYYTRAGNFKMLGDGTLVNADDKPVLGFGKNSTTLSELNLLNLNLAGEATTESLLVGNLESTTPVTTPPAAPQTFQELNSSVAFSYALRVNDSLGTPHDATIAFFKTADNTWTAQAYVDGADTGGTAGQPVLLGQTSNLNFESNGSISDANAANAVIQAQASWGGGAAPGNFTIDLSGFTQFAAPSQVVGFDQNGQGVGTISDYEIKENGDINAVLDSGSRVLIGRVALADFTNVDGLQRSGNSLIFPGANVGTTIYGEAGTQGLGQIKSRSLEASTVDIANQFVDLVLYQRGYQASSQVLNATSTLLHDTIALIR